MGRIVILALLAVVIGTIVVIGGSYLVVFWRDTVRRWKLEKDEDRKRQIREAKQEFIESAKALEDIGNKTDKP
ncbi:MAG: hypothetical protein OEM82_14995 [Acidobacteriota bacterium]|nr:hypothetical protein [Acidobacteriota bacterium]MDH3528169.1 hypothetical protein [Acidobacteriota bacterium]